MAHKTRLPDDIRKSTKTIKLSEFADMELYAHTLPDVAGHLIIVYRDGWEAASSLLEVDSILDMSMLTQAIPADKLMFAIPR